VHSSDKAAAAARVFDRSTGPLTLVTQAINEDAYQRGDIMIVIPGIWSSMPMDLLRAMRDRRLASVSGRCPACDAVVGVADGLLWHERDCHACDDLLGPKLTAWSKRVGQFARGRRLVEDPEGGDR
jgi:hypothetical protein